MGLFQKGSVTARRLYVFGPYPDEDEVIEGLNEDLFHGFGDGTAEEALGFCDWQNPLKVKPDPNYLVQEGWTLIGIRIDTRRVPGSTLAAHLDLAIDEWCKGRGVEFAPKEVRNDLKDEVKAKLIMEATPVTKLVEIAWNRREGLIWTSASSPKLISVISELFFKAWGVDIKPSDAVYLAGTVFPELPTSEIAEWEPMAFQADGNSGLESDERRTFLGRELAVWTWKQALVDGGRAKEEDTSALFPADEIRLTGDNGSVKDVSLKKGNPCESGEAFEALAKGMTPTRFRMKLLDADMEWSFTLNTATMDPSGLKLPPVNAKSRMEVVMGRLALMNLWAEFMNLRLREFLEARRAEGGAELAEVLREWIVSTGTAIAEGTYQSTLPEDLGDDGDDDGDGGGDDGGVDED